MQGNIRDTTENQAGIRPKFGIDAPGVVLTLALVGVALLATAAISLQFGQADIASMTMGPGCSTLLASLLMVLTSTIGKPVVLRGMVASLALHGDEQVLEVGCGRGMLLLETARRLPRGRATGIDLWSTRDQSGNAAAATRLNAELAGLADRVQIDTGDMRRLPYADASFDAIVASQAIHNLPTETDREQAVREIARVLKPGGQVALLDFRCTVLYAQTLRDAGFAVRRSWPEFRMFPWVWIVRGRKTAP